MLTKKEAAEALAGASKALNNFTNTLRQDIIRICVFNELSDAINRIEPEYPDGTIIIFFDNVKWWFADNANKILAFLRR